MSSSNSGIPAKSSNRTFPEKMFSTSRDSASVPLSTSLSRRSFLAAGSSNSDVGFRRSSCCCCVVVVVAVVRGVDTVAVDGWSSFWCRSMASATSRGGGT